jgi:hypothetical protein
MEKQENDRTKSLLDRFLENKLWKIIQILTPPLAIIVTIFIFVISQRPAQITIRGEGYITLLEPHAELRKDVKILYGNDEIANIAKYTLLIQNNSRRDIDGTDIHYLRWYPPKTSTILGAEVTEKSTGQGDFISVYNSKKNVLEIKFDTLNRGVFAMIEVLCSSKTLEPDFSTCKAEGVIAGGSIIEENMRFLSRQKQSFFANVFAGGIWTNLAKMLMFFIAGVLAIVLIYAPIAKISEYIEEQNRRKSIEGITDETDEIERFMIELGINSKDREKIKETFEFFSKLTQSQIELCNRAIRTYWGATISDYILINKKGDLLKTSDSDANTN